MIPSFWTNSTFYTRESGKGLGCGEMESGLGHIEKIADTEKFDFDCVEAYLRSMLVGTDVD